MPETFFGTFTIWKPRKVLRKRQGDITSSGNFFPSRCWIGWEGEISVLETHPSIILILEIGDQLSKLQPVVQWYQVRKSTLDLFLV
jgi:hypothetical protein